MLYLFPHISSLLFHEQKLEAMYDIKSNNYKTHKPCNHKNINQLRCTALKINIKARLKSSIFAKCRKWSKDVAKWASKSRGGGVDLSIWFGHQIMPLSGWISETTFQVVSNEDLYDEENTILWCYCRGKRWNTHVSFSYTELALEWGN